jgi:chlorobactene glucosyltransferase
MELLASLVFAVAVCLLIVRALHQRGLLEELAPVAADRNREPTSAAIIIPARNEAGNIAHCLKSLLNQNYPKDRIAIVVVDDGSSDDSVPRRFTGRVRWKDRIYP